MKERNLALDRFKGLSAVMVILIHAPPLIHSSATALKIAGWALLCFCQIAVPFFFLLSGWMLGRKWLEGRRDDDVLWRSVRRILSIYLPWFGLYLLFDALTGRSVEPVVVVRRFVGFSVGGIDTNGYHLWFLPSLVLAQIAGWWMLRFTKTFRTGMVVGGVFYAGLLASEWMGWKLPFSLVPNEGLNLSLPSFVLGMWLPSTNILNHPGRIVRFLWLSFPLLLVEAFVWNRFVGSHWSVPFFTVSRFLLPALLLAWVVSRPDLLGSGKLGKALDLLGRCSTGIYVMHLGILLLIPFERMVPNGFIRDNLVRWPVALVLSVLITQLAVATKRDWLKRLVA